MQAMVGFRNIALHDHQKLSFEVVKSILKDHLEDFWIFYSVVVSQEAQRL